MPKVKNLPWSNIKDPVAEKAVLNAQVLYFSIGISDAKLKKCINKFKQDLAYLSSYPYLDAIISPHTDFDDVDLVLALDQLNAFEPYYKIGITLEEVLALLTLSEAADGHYTSAVKAYQTIETVRIKSNLHNAEKTLSQKRSKWNIFIENRKTAGVKSGSARRDSKSEYRKRYDKKYNDICAKAKKLQITMNHRNIASTLANQFSLTSKRIRDILNQHCPDWRQSD